MKNDKQKPIKIDAFKDFTDDTPHYWDDFWKDDNIIGVPGADPDISSKTLRSYHKIVWSKRLPCGEILDLKFGAGSDYLTWKNYRLGSDSIIVSFRYEKYRYMLDKVADSVPDYKAFVEDYLHKACTIGGTTIFPKHRGSVNQAKGTDPKIRDRWDLTLECIRRFYKVEDSPLYGTLIRDKDFFDLFIDFKGYVDFFHFQDCVNEDYSAVRFWLGSGDFDDPALPGSVDEYLSWIEKEIDFVAKRNRRIAESLVSGSAT